MDFKCPLRAGHQPVSALLLRDPARGRPSRVLRPDPRGDATDDGNGRIVGVFTASHSPGITGWPERVPSRVQRQRSKTPTAEARARIQALGRTPSSPFGGALHQLPPRQPAAFAIATGESYLGPVTAEMGRLHQRRTAPVSRVTRLWAAICTSSLWTSEFDPALVEGGLDFDENFCVPFKHLDPESKYPLVPVIVNGVNPPWPTPQAVLRLRTDDPRARSRPRASPRAWWSWRPAASRTGSACRSPGTSTPTSTVTSSHRSRPATRAQPHRLHPGQRSMPPATERTRSAPGSSAAGAAGTGFDVLAYEPVPEWLTGTAVAAARLADRHHSLPLTKEKHS